MTKNFRLSTIFSLFFDPKIPLLFLVGTFVTAVGGNAAFSYILQALGGDSGENYLRIFGGAVLGLIFVVVVIHIVLRKFSQHGSTEPNPAFDVPRKGIIYTAGNQTATLRFSIENQRPQYAGFICTKMSEPHVDALIREMGIRTENYRKKLVDPQDVVENGTETQLLVRWLLAQGLKKTDIVIDVTGGMTTMSVGAFSKAVELKIDTQYIKAEYDGNKALKPKSGIFVRNYPG